MNYEQMAKQAEAYLDAGNWDSALRETIKLAAAAGKQAAKAEADAADATGVADKALKNAKAADAGIQDPNI